MRRPDTVAFDVVETLFSVETPRPRLAAVGLPGHCLETWFASVLRDAFALEIAEVYKPFRDIASAALGALLAKEPGGFESKKVDHVLEGFAELNAHDDVAPAMSALQKAGIGIVTLTNGSAKVTSTLLQRAGLHPFVDLLISIDEVGHWKSHREVYLHCARKLGLERQRLALVAAHPWDVQGARRSGLIARYVARDGATFPAAMEAPDLRGTTLVEIVADLMKAA